MALLAVLLVGLYFVDELRSSSAPAKMRDAADDTLEIFVAPKGSDDNTGFDVKNPIQTIQRAQQIIRGFRTDHLIPCNFVVQLMVDEADAAPQYFFLNQTISMNENDGGDAKQHTVTYKTYRPPQSLSQRKANISGGFRVPSQWTQPSPTLQPQLWQVKLPTSTPPFRQMWVNGKRMQAARTQVMQYQSATSKPLPLPPHVEM